MKLIVKLLAAFVFVTLLILVVGYFGLTGATSLSANAREIGRDVLPKVNSLQTLKEAQTAFDSEENGLMGKDVDEASIKDANSMIDEAKKRQDEAIQVYSSLPKGKEESDLWGKFLPALDAFWKEHTAFMDMAKQYQQNRTDDLYKQMTRQPIEVEDPQRDALGDILDQMIALNTKIADSAVTAAEITSARVRLVAIAGLVAGPVLALLLGFVLAFSITRPVAQSVAFAKRIADGDLTQHMAVRRGDEIGILADALNGMSARLAEMVGRVQASAEQLVTSSQQISTSADKLAEGAQSQASSFEETSASMEELSASVDHVAEHAQSQASAAEKGASSMGRALETIEVVSRNLDEISALSGTSVDNATVGANAVQSVVQGISAIAGSSEKIGGIVTVISEIADQTNLLALNASIEAARAGEHGRGFAVVADEVSKLAERSASSTKEIERLIKESIASVTSGVETSRSSEGAMEQIRLASQKVNGMISKASESMTLQVAAIKDLARALENIREMSQSISASTEEQTTNARQVSRAVESANEITQSTASEAHDMSVATERLTAMANELQVLMGQFQVSNK